MSILNNQLLYRRSKRFPLIIHHLLPDLPPGLTLNGSNYPYLEQIFMVPKRFEPSKFDCKQLKHWLSGPDKLKGKLFGENNNNVTEKCPQSRSTAFPRYQKKKS